MKDLKNAIENRQIENFRKIVSGEGFNVNQQDEEGNTALHYATTTPNGRMFLIPLDDFFVEVLATLLQKGANISIKNQNQQTPARLLVNRSNDYNNSVNRLKFYADLVLNNAGNFQSVISLFEDQALKTYDNSWIFKINTQCAKELLKWVKDYEEHKEERKEYFNDNVTYRMKDCHLLDYGYMDDKKFYNTLRDKILIDELYPDLERALTEFNDDKNLSVLLRALYIGHPLKDSIDTIMKANEASLLPLTPESIKTLNKIKEEDKVWGRVLLSAKAEIEPLSEGETKLLETVTKEVMNAAGCPMRALEFSSQYTKKVMGNKAINEKPGAISAILNERPSALTQRGKLEEAAKSDQTNRMSK